MFGREEGGVGMGLGLMALKMIENTKMEQPL